MYKNLYKIIAFFFFWFCAQPSYSLNTAAEEKACAEIGFKVGIEAFGDCVVDLFSRLSEPVYENRKKNFIREQQNILAQSVVKPLPIPSNFLNNASLHLPRA